MFAALPYIAGGLATAITFFVKHPIITKMLIFSAFLGIIGYSVTFIKDIVSPYLVANTTMTIAAYFGLLDGLSLYVTIVVAGFGVKQVLAFIRS